MGCPDELCRLTIPRGQQLHRAVSNKLYLGCPEECGSETKEGRGCLEQVQIHCTHGLSRGVWFRDQGGQRLRRTDSNILYLGCPEECGSETKEGRGYVEQVQIYSTWAVQRSAAPRQRRADAA